MLLTTAFNLGLILALVHFLNAAEIRIYKPKTCGYESCPKTDPKKLNIHIVPHSHDDVGWVKTIEDYYYGRRNDIQNAKVQSIIDTVVEALQKDRNRRFIQVKTAYFWKWWKEQSEKTRDVVRDLVNEGRLEMIGGGWSMADEAVTHYQPLVDQYTWGFRRLNDTLGKCGRPRIGWQIDCFGHSREQASMFAQLGFDGLFFGQLDFRDKSTRLREKKAEFIWKASSSLGRKADLFTSVLFNRYSASAGYCFDDTLCHDIPINDDESSLYNNVDERINGFLSFSKEQSNSYRTNNVLMTMGDDFTYQNAHVYFTNLDELIRYTNERNGTDYRMFYSTPSCYLKSLHDQNLTWSTKSDDFFPYASDSQSYWTGYFTSRPNLKYFERLGNNYLQVTKQLSVLAEERSATKDLEQFRETMGVMQHHDAVTGTEKQRVAEDYARLLHDSFVHGNYIMETALRKLVSPEEPARLPFYSCLLLNVSSCAHSELNDNFVLTVYNPTSQVLSTLIRIPVIGTSYTVKDYRGRVLTTEIVPIAESVLKIPGRTSSARYELIFTAKRIGALGFQSYYITLERSKNDVIEASDIQSNSFLVWTKDKKFDVVFDDTNNIMIQREGSKSETVNISIQYYNARGQYENSASGAYTFRPQTDQSRRPTPSFQIMKFFDGSLVQEFQWQLNEWISGAVRFFVNENYFEYEWLVGPIPVEDEVGKEVITRYSADLKTNGTFYTDSNGREMIERKRNFRPTFDVDHEEPVASNYYPVTNKIYLKDEESGMSLAVLTDRAQGGGSLRDGEIELMHIWVHRRLLYDDGFSVSEPLNEIAFDKGLVTRGRHTIFFGDINQFPDLIHEEKSRSVQLALKPWLAFAPITDISFEEYQNSYKMRRSSLMTGLPENIHILTLEPWKNGTLLLRLEHLYEVGESAKFSLPVKVNILDLFQGFDIVDAEEMTLGANQRLDELKRFEWKTQTDEIPAVEVTSSTLDIENVLLKPMEIRTFIIRCRFQSPSLNSNLAPSTCIASSIFVFAYSLFVFVRL